MHVRRLAQRLNEREQRVPGGLAAHRIRDLGAHGAHRAVLRQVGEDVDAVAKPRAPEQADRPVAHVGGARLFEIGGPPHVVEEAWRIHLRIEYGREAGRQDSAGRTGVSD